MAYIDLYNIAQGDEIVVHRLQIALCQAALTIYSESFGGAGQPTAEQHTKRILHGQRVLEDSARWAKVMAFGIATVAAGTSDAQLLAAAQSVWDAYCADL